MIKVTITIEDQGNDLTKMGYMISEIEPTTVYEFIVAEVIKECIIKVHSYVVDEENKRDADDTSTGSAE